MSACQAFSRSSSTCTVLSRRGTCLSTPLSKLAWNRSQPPKPGAARKQKQRERVMNSNAERGHGTAVEETSAHLLSSVVELARRCAGHLADCEAAQHGWRIYHAIDTDIISLYLAPHENPRYADVFGDAD